MGRNQRDEPSEPAIGDMAGADSVGVNHLIDAMEDAGIIVRS